jgi:hypothetical protein
MLSRRSLIKGSAALLVVGEALAQGRMEKGIYRIRGDVRVNGEPAKEGGQVRAGDSIASGADGEMVFVVNRDAMLVRRDASVSLLADGLRVVTGAVLSVFASGQRKQIQTGTAVIGIRGTAVYIEAERERTYVCTCYGEASLEPVGDPASRETVRTAHHEKPRYVMATGAPQRVLRAPVLNHTDAELILLESLVGRQPPFIGQGVRPY